jgi:hypothetical protein
MLTEIVAMIALFAPAAVAPIEQGDARQTATEASLTWFRNAWTSVRRDGPVAAEKLVRDFPERFKDLPKQAAELQQRASRLSSGLQLEERRTLLMELWRVRHAINVMALLEPRLLEHLTGVDPETLRAMTAHVERARARLLGV